MCGIAGFATEKTRAMTADLKRMTDAIAHRGPDDEGFFEAATRDGRFCVGLGHRRLAIIDLSTGHQPIGNEDGSIQIVFNGEIYNFQALRDELIARGHRFATMSDTETIVHAYEEYGERCVEKFRGMFAFAIWDANKEKLFLARDRFGKKPLFVYSRNGVFLFASEIKALLQYPGVTAEVNQQAVWDYLVYRYVPAPATLFKDIRKVAPGSYAVWEKGQFNEFRYYQPPDREPASSVPLMQDPVGAFREILEESVKIRMVSDVPFGAFLSGGIDSSAIVALMSRHSSLPVKTFSVGFSETQYSELGYARVIAQQFATEHHELTVSHAHLMDELPALTRFRDAPVSNPADIPVYLLAKEARNSVKMVLTGEGGDEFLGGYNKHVFERYVGAYQMIPSLFRHGLIEPMAYALPYRFRSIKTAVRNLGLEDRKERLVRWFGALSKSERDALIALRTSGDAVCDGPWFDTPEENSALRRILYFDQTSWLPDNLLERGDRMTMAASLEARMPFMDHELAGFVSSLPDQYRIRGTQKKWILYETMKSLLPKSILDRPKVGFRMPVNEWLRGGMREYMFDLLTGSDSRTSSYYHRDALMKVLNEHDRGLQNHENLLWTLLNLEIWCREYGVA